MAYSKPATKRVRMSDLFEKPATSSPVIITFAENCHQPTLPLRAKFINGLEDQFGPLREGTKWKSSGLLHVYPSTKAKKEELLSTFKLFGCDISCREPQGALFARGVIRAPTAYSNEDILEQLMPQGVTQVRRFYKGEEPNKIPQLIVNLTFDSPRLPDEVRMAHEVFPVQRFIPRPEQCWNCWKYGADHRSDKCPLPKICKRCAQHHPEYDHDVCSNQPCCPNCKKGDHQAGSTSCRIQRERQESLRLARLNDLTPAEAGNFLRQRTKQLQTIQPPQFMPAQPSSVQPNGPQQPSNQELDTLQKRVTALEKEVTTLKATVIPIPGQVALLQQEVVNLQSSTNSLTIDTRSGFNDMRTMFDQIFHHMGINRPRPTASAASTTLQCPPTVAQRPPGDVTGATIPTRASPGATSADPKKTGNGKPTTTPTIDSLKK